MEDDRYDVLVIGGGEPRHAPAGEMHRCDGTPPGDLLATGRDEVARYGVVVVAPRFTARSGVLSSLGLLPVEQEIDGHVYGSTPS